MTTVVLADDQELIRVGLRVMLETGGIDVVAEAEDGRAAVRACRKHRPDVVLMDIRMPVLDGIAATAEIAEAESLGIEPWVPTLKDFYVRVDVQRVSGRHFVFGPHPERNASQTD